jgi:hypothetical protein
MLTFDQWVKVLEIAWMIGLSILAFGKFMQRADKPHTQVYGTQDRVDSLVLIAALDRRTGALEMRFERAGAETSKLATAVQGWEQRARDVFPDKSLCGSQMHESESDRKQMRDEIGRLWQHVNARPRN